MKDTFLGITLFGWSTIFILSVYSLIIFPIVGVEILTVIRWILIVLLLLSTASLAHQIGRAIDHYEHNRDNEIGMHNDTY